ncbi:MAG: hypothetical protein P4M02_04415 [Clostridia bacterium]|nr:hypothetical protein [Clostridia bacterium]
MPGKAMVRKIYMRPYCELQAAYEDAAAELGKDSRVIVMPYGGSTLPFLNQD